MKMYLRMTFFNLNLGFKYIKNNYAQVYHLVVLYNYSKYKFKCLLTKDPSETSSLEYIIIIN